MKGLIIVILVIVLLCLFIFVGAQNSQLVTVNFVIAQATLQLSTLMAIVLTIGVALGVSFVLSSWLALRVKLGLTKQKLKKLQGE
ncbi:LapA family protein [Alteromonas sp. ASW11-36]|uniref:LapA family protein n=1 Tax=Alteromonas arenosi TaxID=3055817 RepID=A0ABT7SX89_9ALTE|nr:LapA family protein [Alteromonas sp. ASW11-36]MDM7860795.1 LapA family protein [Alteromonas sp. ASW11-36]